MESALKNLRFVPFRVFGLLGLVLSVCAGCGSPGISVSDAQRFASDAAACKLIEFRTCSQLDEGDAPAGLLKLEDAVRRGLTVSPEVQSALAQVAVARAEAEQSRLLPNPVLGVSFRFQEGGGSPIIDAGLSADIISLIQKPGRINAADNRLRGAASNAVTKTLDVLSQIQQRYASVQALDALVPLLEERRRINSRLLGLAEARLKAGESTSLDVTVARSQQVALDVEISEKLLERRTARLELAELIGRPSGAIDWAVAPFSSPATVSAAESVWIEAALQNRPEVRERRYELAALGAEVKLAGLDVFEGASAGVDAERDSTWSVGPAVNTPLPLFDWGQARRAAAQARVIAARHELNRVSREIVRTVRTAYGTYTSSRASLTRVREELIPLAERRRDQAENAYKAGQSDITTVVLADQDLQDARARLIELQQRVAIATIELQRSVGGPTVEARINGSKPTEGAPPSSLGRSATQPTAP